MTKPATHTGYYVTARYGEGTASTTRTAWLVGPFKRHREALAMVAAVSHAVRHHHDDPRFQFAAYGTARLTRPLDKPLPPGNLDLTTMVDDVWISYMVTGGFKRDAS